MGNDNSNWINGNLCFFSDTVTSVNTRRQKIRQTKGMANFLVKQTSWENNLSLWDPSLGLLSFTLYYARLASNLTLLTYQLNFCNPEEKMDPKAVERIGIDILNDTVWSTINLVQFFWLTFNVSIQSGLYGVQLEGVGMLFDEFMMVVEFQKKLGEHEKALLVTVSLQEMDSLNLEWQYKKINLLRSLIHITSFAFVFIGFGMGMITFPISIFIYSVNVMSNVLRITLDILKHNQQLNLMMTHGINHKEILQYKNRAKYHIMQQASHFIHLLILVPLTLILCASGPMALSVGVMMSVFLSDYLIEQALDQSYEEKSNRIALEAEQTEALYQQP